MANKEYVSIFVSRETRNRLKKKAVQLGYPSMLAMLEAFSRKKKGDLIHETLGT